MEELNDVSPKWYVFGTQLRVAVVRLDNIKEQYMHANQACQDSLRETLKAWLKDHTSPPTWSIVVKSLRSRTVGETALAEHLERKYSLTQDTNNTPTHHPAPPVSSQNHGMSRTCEPGKESTDSDTSLDTNKASKWYQNVIDQCCKLWQNIVDFVGQYHIQRNWWQLSKILAVVSFIVFGVQVVLHQQAVLFFIVIAFLILIGSNLGSNDQNTDQYQTQWKQVFKGLAIVICIVCTEGAMLGLGFVYIQGVTFLLVGMYGQYKEIGQRDALQTKLQAKVKEKENALTEEKGKSERLDSELTEEKDKSERLDSELKKEKDKSERLDSELKKGKDKSERLDSELKEEKDKSERLDSELREEKDISERLDSELKQEIERLDDELKKEKDKSETLDSELKEEKDKSERLESELKEEKDEFKKLKSEKGKELKEKEDKFKKLKSEKEKELKEEKDKFMRLKSEKEKELKEEKDKFTRLKLEKEKELKEEKDKWFFQRWVSK